MIIAAMSDAPGSVFGTRARELDWTDVVRRIALSTALSVVRAIALPIRSCQVGARFGS